MRPVLPAALLLGALLLTGPAAAADDWKDAQRDFRKALRAEAWTARRDAFAALAYYDSAEAVEEVLDAIGDEPNPAVVLAGIDTLAAFVSEGARKALVEAVADGRGNERLYAILALERQEGDHGKDALLGLLDGRDEMAAAQAAIALGRKKVASAAPAIAELATHGGWQLRRAAAIALREMGAKETVPALVEGLEASEGRERRDLIEALAALTGQDYGLDVRAWKKLAGGADPATISAREERIPHAFGIPIYGKRVVLILTNSLRTTDPHRFGIGERLVELCRVPGGPPILHTRIQTVGQFAQAHFERLINDLPSDARFELITFNTTVRGTFDRLVGVNGGTRKQAIDMMAGLKSDDGMNHFDALQEALDVSGSKDSVAWKKGPDEIVFTACNTPNKGEIAEPPVVAAAIGLKARLRLVPIHTVGIETHAYEMMKAIAERSGGTYLNLYE